MNTDKQKTRKDKGFGFRFIRVHPCSSVAIKFLFRHVKQPHAYFTASVVPGGLV